MKLLKAAGLFILDFIETIVIALSVFIIVYIFFFQPHQVKGNSMLPNFYDSEYLLTNKINYRFNEPKRGDVIVFKAPQNENYDYIKRIVGLPEDKVSISTGKVFVNDNELDEYAYLPQGNITQSGRYLTENKEITLKNNEYFVMGDNRSNSSDSRDWGPVPRSNIIGKAWLIYWPVNKIGLLDNTVYSDFEGSKGFPTTP